MSGLSVSVAEKRVSVTETLTETVESAGVDAGDMTVLAALVAGAHGVTGNVRLKLIGNDADRTAQSLQAGRTVHVAREAGEPGRRLTIRSLRRGPVKGGWIARFLEVSDRTQAETLYGHGLYIPETQRASLPDGEFYVDQIIGLAVETENGDSLGLLKDVLNTPANDVYVTDTDVLIPAVAEFILKVDLAAGKIVVKDVPGLRDGT